MRQAKQNLINELVGTYGTIVSRTQIIEIANKQGYVSWGFLCGNKVSRGMYDISSFAGRGGSVTPETVVPSPVVELTDEEIRTTQRRRFKTVERMASGVIKGTVRSVIISGPAGIGKTYSTEALLESAADESMIKYTKIKGFVKASGLFKALWDNRNEGEIILIDDADAAFDCEIAMNLLKAALDSSKRREISWRSEKKFIDEVGDEIPSTFEYRGSMIFITNRNFEKIIAKGGSMAVHLEALMSRSFYIDLNFSSTRECIIRIEDVLLNTDMAFVNGLDNEKTLYLIEYVKKNSTRIRDLSLRVVVKLAQLLSFAENRNDFEEMAEDAALRRR